MSADAGSVRSPTAAAAGAVSLVMGMVVGLAFLFGFGNVWTLAVRLGVPGYVAPLVAPAVDLSVVGLLVGIRFLVVAGADREVLRSARFLLLFSSTVTLALNVAEPVIAGHYGRAAFDAVGPMLLIGWAEVGPGLVQAMRDADVEGRDASVSGMPPAASSEISATIEQADSVVGAQIGPERQDPKGQTMVGDAVGVECDAAVDLLSRAREEDFQHWRAYRRPISAEELRKRLRVGSQKSRDLVEQIRSESRSALVERGNQKALTREISTADQ